MNITNTNDDCYLQRLTITAVAIGRNLLSYKTEHTRAYITCSSVYRDIEFGIFRYTRAILIASTYDPGNPIVRKESDYLQEKAKLLKNLKNTDS